MRLIVWITLAMSVERAKRKATRKSGVSVELWWSEAGGFPFPE
jgi:hypothetical protein